MLSLVADIDLRPLSACAREQIREQTQAPRQLWQPLQLAGGGPRLHREQRQGLHLSVALGRPLGVDRLRGAGTFPPSK